MPSPGWALTRYVVGACLFLTTFPPHGAFLEAHNMQMPPQCTVVSQYSCHQPPTFLSMASRSLDGVSQESSAASYWYDSPVVRVLLLQPFLNLEPTNMWWDWNWWFGIEKWITQSLPSQGTCIYITLNCTVTRNPEECDLVPTREANIDCWHSQTSFSITLDASRAHKAAWLLQHIQTCSSV
jgi:hypothetical protein